jgi:diketogulonate reductase-like aldo/keto reductase
MAHNGTTFKLNTGAPIPAIGFGTWQDKEAQEPSVCMLTFIDSHTNIVAEL